MPIIVIYSININHFLDVNQRNDHMISNLRLFKPVQNLRKKDFYHNNFRDKGLDYVNISIVFRNRNVVNKIPVYFYKFEPPIITIAS